MQNTNNQQFAPFYVCPGSKRSRWLREHRLNGSSEDMGSIFELGDRGGRAPMMTKLPLGVHLVAEIQTLAWRGVLTRVSLHTVTNETGAILA